MSEFQVVEKFVSINGEGTKAGQLAIFIRFCGCNLNCSYCDTSWANQEDTKFVIMTDIEILEYIRQMGIKNVTLTGGEPLLQKNIHSLLEELAKEKNIEVEIETNGSILLKPFRDIENGPAFTVDYKLEGSQMESYMNMENFSQLDKKDTVKFVAGSLNDLEKAREVIEEFDLTKQCHVYISPVFGKIELEEIVEYMKEHRLNNVNMQIQMHKIIWNPEERGV